MKKIKERKRSNPYKKIASFLVMILILFSVRIPVFAADSDLPTGPTGSGSNFNLFDPTQLSPDGSYPPDGSTGVLDITSADIDSIQYDINVYADSNINGSPLDGYTVSNLSRSQLTLDLSDTGGFPPLVPGDFFAQNYQIRNNSSQALTFTFQGGIASGNLAPEIVQWLWTYGSPTSDLTSFTLQPGQVSPVFATVFGQSPTSTAQNITGNLLWAWNYSFAYNVNFDSQGGSSVPAQIVTSDHPYATEPSPAPTRPGYYFTGWFTDSATTQAYNFGQPLSGDLTLYAGWRPIPNWTVNFNSQGGSAVPSQTVVDQGQATQPTPAPTRTGYTFTGWFTDSQATHPYDFSQPVTGNLTLYAGWHKDQVAPTPPQPN